MKKIITLLALGSMLHAGSFSWISSLTDTEIESKSFQLETNGRNARLYEFVTKMPKGNKVQCIYVASDMGSGGVWCQNM